MRSLRQRRGDRLGAVQRKLPPVQCLGREGRQLSYDFMSEHVGTENVGYGGIVFSANSQFEPSGTVGNELLKLLGA